MNDRDLKRFDEWAANLMLLKRRAAAAGFSDDHAMMIALEFERERRERAGKPLAQQLGLG